MPDDLWPKTGQRAWQYAGTFGDGTCSIRGLSVDIDVADSGVLVSSGAVTGQTEDPATSIRSWWHPSGLMRTACATFGAKSTPARLTSISGSYRRSGSTSSQPWP